MSYGLHQKCFTLAAASHTIQASLSTALAHIEEKLAGHMALPALLEKSKWIIMELLTNAIRHSCVEEIQLYIILEDKQLVIEKKDSGYPLILPAYKDRRQVAWPIVNGKEDYTIDVYGDAVNLLRAFIGKDGAAKFFIDKTADENAAVSLDDLNEHFGFLIITRSSDSFTYHFDTKTRTNTFRCTIDLDNGLDMASVKHTG